MTPTTPPAADATPLDPARCWVRVVQRHASEMVEFEFAVGEPQLYVEMVMDGPAFTDFCAQRGVTPTEGALADAPSGSAEHEWDWNLRQARERHFRSEP